MRKSIIIGLVSFILGCVASYFTVVRVEHLPHDHPIIYDRHDSRIILCEVLHGELITNVYYPEEDPKIRHDGIELKLDHKEIFSAIDQEIDDMLIDEPKSLGFVHSFWHTKQTVLKEKYQIDWRPPSELNPMTIFD